MATDRADRPPPRTALGGASALARRRPYGRGASLAAPERGLVFGRRRRSAPFAAAARQVAPTLPLDPAVNEPGRGSSSHCFRRRGSSTRFRRRLAMCDWRRGGAAWYPPRGLAVSHPNFGSGPPARTWRHRLGLARRLRTAGSPRSPPTPGGIDRTRRALRRAFAPPGSRLLGAADVQRGDSVAIGGGRRTVSHAGPEWALDWSEWIRSTPAALRTVVGAEAARHHAASAEGAPLRRPRRRPGGACRLLNSCVFHARCARRRRVRVCHHDLPPTLATTRSRTSAATSFSTHDGSRGCSGTAASCTRRAQAQDGRRRWTRGLLWCTDVAVGRGRGLHSGATASSRRPPWTAPSRAARRCIPGREGSARRITGWGEGGTRPRVNARARETTTRGRVRSVCARRGGGGGRFVVVQNESEGDGLVRPDDDATFDEECGRARPRRRGSRPRARQIGWASSGVDTVVVSTRAGRCVTPHRRAGVT